MTVKAGYDFSKVNRVAVQPFGGSGGEAVTSEFVRQLVGTRLSVSDRKKGADVVLTGSVTDYRPGDKMMVFLGDTSTTNPNGQTVVVTNPVVSLSGTQVTSQGAAMGVPNSQVLSVSASVGIIARLIDSKTGDVVWSDVYSYEGMDVQSAMQAVVGSLVRSLAKVVPAANRQRS